MKFANRELRAAIRDSPSPALAKETARCWKHLRRTNWSAVKDQVMLRALHAKFTQHAELAGALLATGTAVLIEDSTDDSYWGWGHDHNGCNRLGNC